MAAMNLHIIALETSSSLCSVALLVSREGQLSVRSLEHEGSGEHAERLLPMVDELLRQEGLAREQLDAVAFGQGPGGFTGLRVACGVAQGMAFALGVPVIPVSSLQAVAAQDAAAGEGLRVVLQDARMREVYAAAFQPALTPAGLPVWRVVHDPVLLGGDDVSLWLDTLLAAQGGGEVVRLLGDARDAVPELSRLESPLGADSPAIAWGDARRADAEFVARLACWAWQRGEAIEPEHAAPVYVRDKVAYTTAERQAGLGGNPRAGLPISIVPMSESDLAAVAEIERAVQAFPWTLGNFRDALQAGYGAWVARQHDAVLGFALVMFAPDIAHLLLIAVEPGAQRTGVGHRLLRFCEQETVLRGLPALMLEVRPSNERAVAFYRNRGFAHIATRKGYYPTGRGEREDAWVMEKTLSRTQERAG